MKYSTYRFGLYCPICGSCGCIRCCPRFCSECMYLYREYIDSGKYTLEKLSNNKYVLKHAGEIK